MVTIMTLNDLGMIFKFIGGLGMFLYGMHIMADGLQKSAGGKLKKLMGFLTKNRFIAVLVGAGITAIIQSSSATTVMVVGFVNAGMLNLTQAVGVIMGANVGTTVTAWIVSLSEFGSFLKPEFYAPVLVGFGAFMLLFAKTEKKNKIGEILVGIGVLFIGLSFMSDSIKPYRDSEVFFNAFAILGKNPLLAILAGTAVTAILQSSSASVGILQTLALNGMVNWRSAVFITLGQNIGTCVTALLSGAGAGKNAKRASVIHLLFNMIGSIIFGILMFVIFKINTAWASSTINSVQISIFHTIFNVANTLILFPFASQLVRLSEIIIKDSVQQEEEESIESITARKLDRRILANPSFALETAKQEVDFMAQLTLKNLKLSLDSVTNKEKETIKQVFRTEEDINKLERMLTKFLVEVDNLSLTENQHLIIKNLFYTISDIERIGDHSENIAELADTMRKDKVQFSKKGVVDLASIAEESLQAFTLAIEARKTNDKRLASQVEEYENLVDQLEEDFREKHILRLSKGKCEPESGVLFLDILSNLERVADHASNIAGYVMIE